MESKTPVSLIDDARILLDIIDHLPTSIFVKNENLQFELSNAAHCEMIGQPAATLLGRSDADFWPAGQAAGFLDRDRLVLQTGETVEVVENATNRHGETMPVLTRKSKLVTPDGRTFLIGTNTNIAEIRGREEQYRALAEAVPVGIWQVRDDGATVFANPLLLVYLGIDAASIHDIGQRLTPPDRAESFPGEACKFEIDVACGAGRTRRVLVASSGWLTLPSHHGSQAFVSVMDISEMNELRRVNDEISRLNHELADNVAKLKEARDEITRRGRMAQLGHLTATVAHEIRNPLGAVRTAAYLIERKLKDKGTGTEPQLLRIANGISRCDAIITQLLDFSRIKALETETLCLDDWLASVVEEEVKSLPAALSVRCELGLGGVTVAVDPAQMRRAIVNLVANASEAMVGKGDNPASFACANPEISIASRHTSRGIEISVSDNGPGIPPDNLERILEPLFTTKSFGTGLGLPAVEKVMQNHGGGISAESEPGKGATFTLWLPETVKMAA